MGTNHKDEGLPAAHAQVVWPIHKELLQDLEVSAVAQRAAPAGRIVVTEAMHVAACKVLLRAHGLDGLPQRMLDAMLAAAPADPHASMVGVKSDLRPGVTIYDLGPSLNPDSAISAKLIDMGWTPPSGWPKRTQAALAQQAVPGARELLEAFPGCGDMRGMGAWCGQVRAFLRTEPAAPAAPQASQGAAPAPADDRQAENAVAMAWNTVRAEARALTAQRLTQTGGLSDLLAAVEEYGDRRVAQATLVQAPAVTHGWQSIETAPVDGSKVLLLWGDHENEICIGWYEERTSKTYLTPWRRDKWGLTETPYGAKPTHWMSLPTNSRPPVHPDGEAEAAPQAEQQAELSWLPSGNILARCPACVQFDNDATCSECRVFVPRSALAAQQAEREPLTNEQIEVLRKQDDCGEDAPEFARIIRIAELALADRWGVKLGGIGHQVPGQGAKRE